MKASTQNTALTSGDILTHSWTSFDIPKGAARLLGTTIRIRNNRVANSVGSIDLLFAKDDGTNTAPSSFGTGSSVLGASSASFKTDIVGYLPSALTDVNGAGILAANTKWQSTTSKGIVFESSPTSGLNVGYDRYYLLCIANAALDLTSLVALDDDVTIAGEDGTIDTLDGTAPRDVFKTGDIIHAEDDIILGEVASVSSSAIVFKFDGSTSASVAGSSAYTVPADIAAWRIQNGAGTAGDLANNELLYSIYPIEIVLHFER